MKMTIEQTAQRAGVSVGTGSWIPNGLDKENRPAIGPVRFGFVAFVTCGGPVAGAHARGKGRCCHCRALWSPVR
ncbi:MAG: hypothetical protein HN380_25900 [Victivallales bacterium]|nr:hypothetical protein [Victivallales bacterium]